MVIPRFSASIKPTQITIIPNGRGLSQPLPFDVRVLLAEIAAPPVLVFPDWDAVIDKSRPFRLHCDASTDGLGATLEQEQPDGSIRPIVYISRATLFNERNWTPMELEAGCVVRSIRRLRRYLFSVFFLIFTDHECLQQISKIDDSKPRIERWMEFISVYNYHLSYRRGRDNANADILSRLLILPTTEDISGSSALTDPDGLGVYLMRACSYTSPSCPIPGVGLGGLTPPSDNNLGTAWHHSPTLVLDGLPLTQDDFRTHRTPMPLRRRAGPLADASVYIHMDHIRPTQSTTSLSPLGPPVLDAHEVERPSWQVTPHSDQTITGPPAVGSPRPPLQRFLRGHSLARPRSRDRIA